MVKSSSAKHGWHGGDGTRDRSGTHTHDERTPAARDATLDVSILVLVSMRSNFRCGDVRLVVRVGSAIEERSEEVRRPG